MKVTTYSIYQDWLCNICRNTTVPKLPNFDVSLPHLNLIKLKHWTEYYNEKTSAIVGAEFTVDIETFGYGFVTGPQLLVGINRKLVFLSVHLIRSISNR